MIEPPVCWNDPYLADHRTLFSLIKRPVKKYLLHAGLDYMVIFSGSDNINSQGEPLSECNEAG